MANREQISVKERRSALLTKMLGGTINQVLRTWWLETYKKTTHTFDKDLSWAYKKMRTILDQEHENIIASHIAMYDRNAEAAFEMGNIQGSNQALQFKEKLLKLHNVDQPTFVQTFINGENLSVQEIKELLEKYDKEDEDK